MQLGRPLCGVPRVHRYPSSQPALACFVSNNKPAAPARDRCSPSPHLSRANQHRPTARCYSTPQQTRLFYEVHCTASNKLLSRSLSADFFIFDQSKNLQDKPLYYTDNLFVKSKTKPRILQNWKPLLMINLVNIKISAWKIIWDYWLKYF